MITTTPAGTEAEDLNLLIGQNTINGVHEHPGSMPTPSAARSLPTATMRR